MDLRERVSLRIKTLRQERGFSQEALAEQMGRSVDALSAIERGKSLPNYETLERLAKALAIPVHLLFDDRSVPEDSVERTALLSKIDIKIREFDDTKLETVWEMLSVLSKD